MRLRLHRHPSLILQIICLIAGTGVVGQQQVETNGYMTRGFVATSPATANLGVYNQTPVSHFTGTPNISVPLYEVSYKDIVLNLYLSYHQAMGNKPDAFPGSTGLGWVLNSGGMITRLSRGVTPANYPNPATVPAFFNPTADADWSSAAEMQGYLSSQALFVNANGRYDEYAYNFIGGAGKFFTDHTDHIQFKTPDGEELLIEPTVMATKTFTLPAETQAAAGGLTGPPYTQNMTQQNFIYRFVITDSKGFKYTFGGTDESIEFVRPGMISSEFDLMDQNTIPTTWYLTSIKSPNGYTVNLSYRRGNFYVTSETYVSGIEIDQTQWNFGLPPLRAKVIRSTMFHPCYLDEITTPVSTVDFNWSASLQLGYTFDVPNPPGGLIQYPLDEFYFCRYPQVKDAVVTNRFPDKLDNFTVTASGAVLNKQVEFTYNNSSSERLKLLSVKIKGSNVNTLNYPEYKFEYNPTSLPEYLSFKLDKYGYYNNSNPYINSTTPSYYRNFFMNATNEQNYFNSRAAVASYCQAEILKKIIYPTGGSTEFEFELNQYSKIAKFWPATIQDNSASPAVSDAGLRIKKVTQYDYGTHIASEKRYFYKQNYATGGTASSGVINYIPDYFKSFAGTVTVPAKYNGNTFFAGTMGYRRYHTDGVNLPNLYKGSPITYTEVAEVNPDNSYIVYKYKNYDNGYHDRAEERMLSDNAEMSGSDKFWEEDEMNLMDLERGQILFEEVYDAAGILKKSTKFEYDVNTDRFQNHVRRVKAIPNPFFNSSYQSMRYVATLVYTYYPFLAKKTVTETEYGNSIGNVLEYTYNSKRLMLTSKTTTSDQLVSTQTFTYPPDYPSDPVLSLMSGDNVHMIAPVIENKMEKGTTQTLLNRVAYHQPFTAVFVPLNIKTQVASNTIETRQLFNLYDNKGNLLEQQRPNDTKEAFFFGYKSQHLVAKVTGSDYNTAKAFISQTILDNELTTDAAMRTELNKLRTNLPAAQVTTYTYSTLTGMTSKTDPRGKTEFYEYDDQGRLSIVRDQDQNVVRRICYSFAGLPQNCAPYANEDKSGTYTRNNCGIDYTPGSVPVNVPPGMFTSMVSAADANTQATSYAQQQANTFGSCTPSCSFTMFSPFVGVTSSISGSGGTINFFLVFYSTASSGMVPGTSYSIASVNGFCKPPANRVFNVVSGGRTFEVTVTTSGTMSAKITSGTTVPMNTTVNLTGSYPD